MDQFEPKLIYLTRRHPALSRPAFTKRWRQHARLGMSLPRWRNISRYVHCDLIKADPELGLKSDYDGVGMIWHRSADHRQAHLADTSSRDAMEADEAQTFAVPIADVCLVAREEIIRGPDPSAKWKLVRFADDDSPSTEIDASFGRVRNRPLPPENSSRWGLDYALVEEFWFPSRKMAEAAARALAINAIVVMGRDVLLYP